MIKKRTLKRLAIVGLMLLSGLAGALGYGWLKAPDYRAEIEGWAASVYDQPLSIGALETDWRGWTVQLRNVRLLGGAEAPRVEQVRLRINPFASLWKRSPRFSQVELSGLTLTLMRELNGSIRVSGIASRRGGFLDWVLKQPELVIKDSHLTWDDRKAARSPLDLRQLGLRIHNDGTHHLISLSTRLPHELGGSVRIAWQAVGDLREGGWSGEVSLVVKNVRVAGLGTYLGIGEFKQGRFTLRCRSEWRDGRPMHLNGAFDVFGFSFHDHRTEISARGDFTGSYHRDGWVATLDPLRVRTNHGGWPKTKLTLMLGDAKTGDKRSALLRAEYLRLQDIYPVLSVVAPGRRDQLRPVRSGELRDFVLVYLPKRRQQLLYRGEFSKLALAPSGGPVIEQAAGTVVGDRSLAKIRLSVGFVRPDISGSVIALTDGEVLWRRNVGVDIAKLHLVSGYPRLNAKLSGRLVWHPNARPSVRASATFSMDGGAYWLAYLPPELIPRGARAWLSAALPSGRVTRGRIEYNQPAEKKPSWDSHFTVEDATLAYGRGWPPIEGLDAEVDLDRYRLEVELKDGIISGARIQAASLRLPDLASPRKELIIEGQASGPYSAGRQFVMASPLRETVGKQIKDLAISGPIVVDLALKLPLPRGTRRPEVKGSVRFAAVRLQAQRLGVELENLSGLLRFDRRRRWGRGFEARYLSRPAQMDIDISPDEKEPSRISLRGEADRSLITALSTKLNDDDKNTELLRRIHGHARWQATVTFPKNWYEAGARSELRIRSDLQGLALLFPEPLGKRADEERLLEIRSELGGPDRREIAISYAGGFAAELAVLKGKMGSSLQAPIRLDDSRPRSPPVPAPIYVMGELRRFDFGEWLELVRASKIDAAMLLTQQITLELRLHQLELFGHTVSDLKVRARREQGNWQVRFDGPSLRGRAKLADSARSVRMHLQHLKLASTAEQRQGRDIDPARLPALWVQCERFQYNGMDLGKMALYSEPQASGMRVKALSFTAPDLKIDAKGSWELVRGRHATTLEANVKGQDLSVIMKRLAYDMRTMEAGETEAAMRLRWRGTPAEFGIDKLSGRISLGIAQGRLLDVEPRIGRIFGLLNFQSLQRRLSLDFDDLFKKGFAFDRVTGSFQLDGGNAYTNDLTLVGPSARVEISGHIGLARRDYEQVATVTPELASSLPVASALFGPVGVGVGAALLLAEQVFDSLAERIDGMVRRHYTITGPWERPIVKALRNANAAG